MEQKNYTHVRQWFGYERHDNPQVVGLINELCKGSLGQLLNLFLPTMKLQSKRREGSKTLRVYDRATMCRRSMYNRGLRAGTYARLWNIEPTAIGTRSVERRTRCG